MSDKEYAEWELLNEIHTLLAKSDITANKYQELSIKIIHLKQLITGQKLELNNGFIDEFQA